MESVAQSIVTNAVELLNAEYQQLRGVGGKVIELSNDLAAMSAVLRMLSEAEADADEGAVDHLVREWEKQLRELAYDPRDCVDLYKLHIRSSPNGGLSTRMKQLLSTLFARRQLAGEIDALRARATAISERHARYSVYHGLPHRSPSRRLGARLGAQAAHAVTYGIAEHLMANRQLIHTLNPVGAEEDMKKLQTWMEIENKHSDRAVLSIVGVGGVGKSTIATALYRDFSNEFDCRASVTVSQIYDEDQILRDILGQIKPWDRDQEQQDSNTRRPEKNQASGMKGFLKRVVPLPCGHRKRGNDGSTHWTQNKIDTSMTRGQLIQELHWRLNGKRYILLIDDIWAVDTWENIRDWLPPEKGSKVIVTSRFQAVGAVCSGRDGIDYLHTVYPLRYDMSESLFKHAVSGHLHSARRVCDPQSSNSSEEEKDLEIWRYCCGLPLAIVTVAGLVAFNPMKNKYHWATVFELLFPGQVASLTLDGVTRILDFCYNDFPRDLKTCSLYLSIFPKGSKISKKRLTRRWIFDRHVTERYGLSAEEVAEIYFNQLIRRKIIRPEDHNSNGKVKSFKVHDMILEYIVHKSSEENFITIVGGHWMLPTPSNKARRLSVKSSGHKHGNSIKGMDLSHVRSLTVFGRQNRRFPFHSFNNGIIQELDLEGWKGMTDKYLNDIFEMLALKYLSLRRTEVVKIPSKIGKLEYLETLDIRETRVEVFPRAFGQLKRLRSMLGGTKNPKKALKLPLEKNKEPMKALEVLSGIEINMDSAAVASLHQMTGLKKLAIYKLNIQEGHDAAARDPTLQLQSAPHSSSASSIYDSSDRICNNG